MPDTGWIIASSGANIGANGTDWTNPGFITNEDASYATIIALQQNWFTKDLTAAFAVSLPADATVTGIEIRIVADTFTLSGSAFADVWLTKDGEVAASDAKQLQVSPTTEGGDGDLWGATWSRAEVVSGTFGCQMRITTPNTGDSATAYVTAVYVKVFYTEPGGDPLAKSGYGKIGRS